MDSDEDELLGRLEDLRMWQDRNPLTEEQLKLMQHLGLSLDCDAFLPDVNSAEDIDDTFFENIERQIEELRSENTSIVKRALISNKAISCRNNLDDTPVLSHKKMDFVATPLKTIDLNQINIDEVLPHSHFQNEIKVETKITKRPFLKKGEGLTQRFRLPPEHFNLKNIPKYTVPKRHIMAQRTNNSGSSKEALSIRRSSTGNSLNSNSKVSQKFSLNTKDVNNDSNKFGKAKTVSTVGSSSIGSSTKTSPTEKQQSNIMQQAWEDEFYKTSPVRSYRLSNETTHEHLNIFQSELEELSSFERIEKKVENNESIQSTPQHQLVIHSDESHVEKNTMNKQLFHPYDIKFSYSTEVSSTNDIKPDAEKFLSSDMELYNKNLMSTPKERGFSSFKKHLVLNELSQTNEINSKDLIDDTVPSQQQELNDIKNTLFKRLKDLENEIAMFQKENAVLIKMKQQYELEKVRFEQKRDEMHAKLSDERIKMEVFFHDERMKIKEKQDELDKRIKEIQRPSKRDRDEIVRLNAKVNQLETEMKAKEVKHGAVQARYRTQLRQLEKQTNEQKLEIDSLKRDNKRLEAENVRLRRENNSKMLQEINKNVAKLIPTTVSSTSILHSEDRVRLKHVVAKVNSNAPNRALTSHQGNSKPNMQDIRRSSRDEINNCSKNDDPEDFDVNENFDDNENSGDDFKVINGNEISSFFKRSKISPMKGVIPLQRIPSQVKTPTTPTGDLNKKETLNPDGSKDIYYANGNLKKISCDGMVIKMLYFNNDIKETNINEGTVKYYYAANNTWQTTYGDGKEVLEFPK